MLFPSRTEQDYHGTHDQCGQRDDETDNIVELIGLAHRPKAVFPELPRTYIVHSVGNQRQ